ncbi:cyclic nucleotide-gated cation channel alpha-3-like [Paramacrobiotus metropolitanus]|uniref:cyclic nucleotide-gated cation channel alpha-3-like n=1 Tax=Paramacrobiotus metropolitanus TaxID=2943436 RepID=UPI0024464F2F|nr:cyclic nucleotide-gated cation channel alpha-3-like [Paramacrobiotus metropolitanus]
MPEVPTRLGRTPARAPRLPRGWQLPNGRYLAFPVVVDPFGNRFYRWQCVIALAVLYNVFVIPGRMAFQQLREPHLDTMWMALDYICDGIYLIDIVVHLYLGIPRKGNPASDLRISRREYFRSTMFKLDVISILPTDVFYTLLGTHFAALRLNRILRMHRIHHLIERTRIHFAQGFYFGFFQVVMYAIIFIHFNGCLYYALNYGQGFGYDEWTFPVFTNMTNPVTNESMAQEGNFLNLYLRSFQWAIVVLAQDVDGLIYANVIECLLRIFVTIEGMMLLGAGIAIAEHLLASKNRHLEAYQRRLDAVKRYMVLRPVDKAMRKRVLGWFNYVWEQKLFSDEQTDLEVLSPILRLAIAKAAHMDTFQRVKLFRGCEPQALEELIMRLQLQFYCPGDLVFRKGDHANEMYIVRSGLLQVVSEDGKEVYASLSQGSVFGEVSLLGGLTRSEQKRTNTVRSQSYSELFTLSNQDFHEVLENYPLAKQAVLSRSRPVRTDGSPTEELPPARTEAESLETRVEKLTGRTPLLLHEINAAIVRMASENNRLKKTLHRLEKLDKVHDFRYSSG